MKTPNPALVSVRAAQRLPRVALLLLCAAYLLPGVFHRDPWRNADVTAFGYMVNIAEGRAPWLAPSIAGLASDAALLPYWLGAASIKLLGPLLGAALAARIVFDALLAAVLTLTWYTTYHLARTDAAQPLPFAFGGEADPLDYSRAIADGALLALIATLGLYQLGHETTPELAQLSGIALFMYGLASCAFRGASPRIAVLVALPTLAASGAPTVAAALGVVGIVVCLRSSSERLRRFVWIVAIAWVAALAVASLLGAWGWRAGGFDGASTWVSIAKLLLWFTWPVWPLAFWTLWRWRHHLSKRHIAVPLGTAAVSIVACIAMAGSDRALMLALPPLAVLAAFILPTLQRSTAAALDWFSVFFFTICVLALWVVYAAMQTGVPQRPARNVARLVPGFVVEFSWVSFAMAALGTAAWLWLVRWRTGRNRHPLWKSLVLPASGSAVCWLMLMTLFLPVFDFARSYTPLVERVARHVSRGDCIAAVDTPRGLLASLEHHGGYRVDGVTPAADTPCRTLLRTEYRSTPRPAPPGWTLVAREPRPTGREELTAVYRRAAINAK